ncbi:hypothetical protein NLX83_00985 [Allokutzneria sp. A3M-2-11 16]|uniref:hypothetical protein n=1 Tax=Allokutzneria sp. A3M-2-11 16 TaxID=2962043 RepID=UPI0020B69CD9|nr:hypothetical protein [Allokutzneria sp. A3M-2-11 16]MCP3797824.1 hypothetical protein [Allokutzneria sp. A3M-2-11 16]
MVAHDAVLATISDPLQDLYLPLRERVRSTHATHFSTCQRLRTPLGGVVAG